MWKSFDPINSNRLIASFNFHDTWIAEKQHKKQHNKKKPNISNEQLAGIAKQYSIHKHTQTDDILVTNICR